MKKGTLLVVDDNEAILASLRLLMAPVFARVATTPHPHTIPSMLQSEKPDVVLLDMNFGRGVNNGNEGLFWLQEILRLKPGVPVVLFTAYADIDLAVRGLKLGARDFVVKPFDNQHMVEVLTGLCHSQGTKARATQSQSGMNWGQSEAMQHIRTVVERVAPTEANILIMGENGTGKEMLAREIHRLSSRAKSPLVTVDMGAVPATLFESELFGHMRGAFTGATTDKPGKMVQANGGTLFLDEIGNLSTALQAKLLTALQRRAVAPLGGRAEVPVDIRLVTATNMDVEAMVEQNAFRQDLLYRINTISLRLPALRERRDDILPLARLFLNKHAAVYGRMAPTLSAQAEQMLCQYTWPGNIRQLEHTMERALILCEGAQIVATDLHLPAPPQPTVADAQAQTLEDMERQMVVRAMNECGGNMSAVAQRLGISRQTLYNKIRKYGL